MKEQTKEQFAIGFWRWLKENTTKSVVASFKLKADFLEYHKMEDRWYSIEECCELYKDKP